MAGRRVRVRSAAPPRQPLWWLAALGAAVLCLLDLGCPLASAVNCSVDDDCPADGICHREFYYCVPALNGGGPPSADATTDANVASIDGAGQDQWRSDDSGVDAAAGDAAESDSASGDAGPASDATGADAATPDAAQTDAAATDRAEADAAGADAAGPDGAQADAAEADAATPDAAEPDTAMPDAAMPDTAMPDTAMPDAADPPVVQAHEQGTGTISDSQTEVTIGLSSRVDPSKSILFFNVTTNSDGPANGHTGGQIVNNGNDVRFKRRNAQSGVPIAIAWSVVQLDGVLVQRGTENAPSGTLTTDATLGQAIDQSRAFPLYSYHLGGGSYNNNDWREAYFTDNQTLRFERVQGNDPGEIDWQVVEFLPGSGGQVRHGSASLRAGIDFSTTVSLDPATTPSSAFLVFGYQLSGSGTLATELVRGRIDSASQLVFEHASTDLGISITWYLVEWDAIRAQHGTVSFSSGQQDRSASLGQAVDLNRAVSFCPSYQRQGQTDHTGNDVIGEGWFTTQLTSGTNLDVHRAASASNAEVDWTVVEF